MLILRLATILLLVLSLAGCSGDDETKPTSTTGSGGSGTAGGGGDGGGSTGGGGATAGCDALAQNLDTALASVVATQTIPGAASEVRFGECLWQGAAGLADREASTTVQPGDSFRIGSVTKTFIATVAVMLHGEGALSLDDPVSKHVMDVPNGDNITVRQVLNHTSGLFNYTDDGAIFSAGANKVWTPAELVALSAKHPPDFAPGEGWNYSNTGYIIVGMVIEAVTSEKVAAQLRSRVLEPLGLESTYLDGDETPIDGLIKGYAEEQGKYVDATNLLHPSAAWTAGALVSTTSDVNTFFKALLAGTLLSDDERAEMTTFVTAYGSSKYGLGLLQEVGGTLGQQQGHSGGIWGFTSLSLHYTGSDAWITVLINSSSDNVSAVYGAVSSQVEQAP